VNSDAADLFVFVFGPFGGFALAPLSMIAIAVTSYRRRAVLLVSSLLMVVFVVAFVRFWYFWGKGFDYADAEKPVPRSVNIAQDTAAAISVLACAALLLIASTALATKLRERRTAEDPAALLGS
jgi:formate hydrogenlyase subunit 3/multisubunit Na+/H+ antiporter MnhD subunit